MKSKPAPRKPRGVVARFVAGESMSMLAKVPSPPHAIVDCRYCKCLRIEAILRRALLKGMKP